MSRRFPLLLTGLLIASAAAGYRTTLWYVPHAVMQKAYTKFKPANHWVHADVLSGSKGSWVPLGNPDIVASRASYDLSQGPLLLTGSASPNTYWSLTMYDGGSLHFFLINGEQLAGKPYRIALVRAGDTDALAKAVAAGAIVAESPTTRGYLMQRTFVTPSADFAVLKPVREAASITPLK